MPENTEVTPGGEAEPIAPPAAEQVQQQQQQQQGAQQAQQQVKNVVVPTSAMKRIKDEEYQRGKQAALEELAQSTGFESHADMVAAMARLRTAECCTPRPR